MSELTSIRKIIVGSGAEQYLPFGLSKLRQMAADSQDGYASRVWRTDGGVTVMVEFQPPSSGTVTVIGTGFLCLGRIGLDGNGYPEYALVGGSSLKKKFKELARFSIDFDWVLKDYKAPIHVYPGGHNQACFGYIAFHGYDDYWVYHLCMVKPNGEITHTLNTAISSLTTGVDSTVAFGIRIGRTDPDAKDQDRYLFLGSATETYLTQGTYEYEKVFIYALISEDGGKTWGNWFRPLPNRIEHQHFHTVAYLGNGVVVVLVSILSRKDGDEMDVDPYLMRSEDGGYHWTLSDATSLFMNGEPDHDNYGIVASSVLMAPLGHDTVLLAYEDNGHAWTCLSEDNGLTWGHPIMREWSACEYLLALGPGGAYMLARFGDEEEGIWKLALTGDYGKSWAVRDLPHAFVGDEPRQVPSLVSRPPLRDESHTVDIDQAVLVIPVYADDGYYAHVTTDGGTTWTKLGQIIEIPKQQEIEFGFENFYYIAVLSEAGDIAFPRLYANNGEPLS